MERNRKTIVLLQIGDHMWQWKKNLDFIKSNEKLINKESYEVISNEKFYSPEFHESFHDGRIVKMEIDNGKIDDFISRSCVDKKMTLTLIGPYYDFYHIINYEKVRSYSLSGSFENSDLIEHYFSIAGDFIVHNMFFQFGNITIFFERIKVDTIKIGAVSD